MKYILQTERLSLREFTINDTAFIVELLNSPGWIKYIGDKNIKTEEQAKEYLENGPLKSYDANGFGLCLVETKDDKTPIGMCGLIKRDDLQNPDIGFAFLPQFIGKGYGFEIASALITFAKDTLKIPTILAITLPDNKRSIQLIEKIGLKFSNTFISSLNEELMLFSSSNP